tara:strand:+ start:984 stop:1196 length:213 start_codon:yes stop_codon:yes gene_type:complete
MHLEEEGQEQHLLDIVQYQQLQEVEEKEELDLKQHQELNVDKLTLEEVEVEYGVELMEQVDQVSLLLNHL